MLVLCWFFANDIGVKSALLQRHPPAAAQQRATSRRCESHQPKVALFEELFLRTKVEKKKKTGKQSEFELNVGRTIDVMRNDLSNFLERELDYSIYRHDVVIRDPMGFGFNGIDMYKKTFSMVRIFKRVMIDDVHFTYKFRYDCGEKRFVVHWYSRWYSRWFLWCGSGRACHVDGVSYFHLDDSGKVNRHVIDRVIFDDALVLSVVPVRLGARVQFTRRLTLFPSLMRNDF
jgi:hypothetical protein